MLKIRKYNHAGRNVVEPLTVDKSQVRYVGTIEELFQEKTANWHFQLKEPQHIRQRFTVGY